MESKNHLKQAGGQKAPQGSNDESVGVLWVLLVAYFSDFCEIEFPREEGRKLHQIKSMLEEELEKKNVSQDTFQSLSRVQLSGTLWTIVRQALLSMGFSSKKIGVGCHFFLQGSS